MKQNYQKELDKIIDSIKDCSSTKPSLLLHACCGPCSSYVIEYLAQYFDITILYYNPNIYPQEEYTRRLEELKNLLPVFPPAKNNNVILIEQEYNPEDFYSAIKIKEEPELANEPEKGERCRRCYNFRLKRAYEYAKIMVLIGLQQRSALVLLRMQIKSILLEKSFLLRIQKSLRQ